jgi:hypothetical protein
MEKKTKQACRLSIKERKKSLKQNTVSSNEYLGLIDYEAQKIIPCGTCLFYESVIKT